MGKASRRQNRRERASGATAPARPAPFVSRPFTGLPGETDWVAMREVIPSATAAVRLDPVAPPVAEALEKAGGTADGAQVPDVRVVTMLPMAWPGLRRDDGEILVSLQAGTASGDPSRDVAGSVLELLSSAPGTALRGRLPATEATPRLQDILVLTEPFDIRVHDGFDFWLAEESPQDPEAAAALERANESVTPTVKLAAAPSAYWCRAGARAYLRWFLPYEEDEATDALARLHVSGGDLLGPDTRLLGAFRASGLLAPVWDLDPALGAEAYEEPLAAMAARLAEALGTSGLSAEERRAKAGLLSRQLTLR